MSDELDWDKKCQLIADAIGTVAKKFQEEPASFLSERDIQALLFAELFSRFDRYKQRRTEKHTLYDVFNEGDFEVNPIKTEYRAEGARPIDIVILSDCDCNCEDWWRLPARVGIEIKLRQVVNGPLGRYLGEWCQGDFGKLKKYAEETKNPKFTGLCLIFSHWQSCGQEDERMSTHDNRIIPINPSLTQIRSLIPDNDVAVLAFTHEHGGINVPSAPSF